MKIRVWEENIKEMRLVIYIGDHSIDITLPKEKRRIEKN